MTTQWSEQAASSVRGSEEGGVWAMTMAATAISAYCLLPPSFARAPPWRRFAQGCIACCVVDCSVLYRHMWQLAASAGSVDREEDLVRWHCPGLAPPLASSLTTCGRCLLSKIINCVPVRSAMSAYPTLGLSAVSLGAVAGFYAQRSQLRSGCR